MAAGVVTNFLVQAQTPSYFPLFFKHSPSQEEEQMQEDKPEAQDEEEEKEVDEDEEEDEESEAQEEEEEGLEEVFLDVTKQLLRFADLISHDVQRYFGRCSSDQEACNIYSDSVTVTGSGRLRYYDDLLKIARAESPEEQENCFVTCADDQEVRHPKTTVVWGPWLNCLTKGVRVRAAGEGAP
nr:ribosome quality control complex subunit 2-like [Labrus bergylta]